MPTNLVNIKDAVHWKPDYVYIGRGSKWGNPFKIGVDGTREEVIEKYRLEVLPKLVEDEEFSALRGRSLVCHCWPEPCHGEVMIAELDKDEETGLDRFFE